jgi:hypothetical protein
MHRFDDVPNYKSISNKGPSKESSFAYPHEIGVLNLIFVIIHWKIAMQVLKVCI